MIEIEINIRTKIFDDPMSCGDGYTGDWVRNCCRFKIWDARNSSPKCVLYDVLLNLDGEKTEQCKNDLEKQS